MHGTGTVEGPPSGVALDFDAVAVTQMPVCPHRGICPQRTSRGSLPCLPRSLASWPCGRGMNSRRRRPSSDIPARPLTAMCDSTFPLLLQGPEAGAVRPPTASSSSAGWEQQEAGQKRWAPFLRERESQDVHSPRVMRRGLPYPPGPGGCIFSLGATAWPNPAWTPAHSPRLHPFSCLSSHTKVPRRG